MTLSTDTHNNSFALRAKILHFTDQPDVHQRTGYEYFADGVLVVENGLIKQVGSAEELVKNGFDLAVCEHFPEHLIMPGFIDSHIHYPQTNVIASYGEQLMDWLNQYTFPAELQYSDKDFALKAAEQFIQLMLENGTTTAMVYTTVFAQSTEAFFEVAQKYGLRMIAGKVMMDRNAPDGLLDTVETARQDSQNLIDKWHGKDRLSYALTPRFAPTSTPEQLAMVGELYQANPSVYMQTHLSENIQEMEFIKQLFPEAKDYLDVYDEYDLLGQRSVFGHGIHLSDDEINRLAETDSQIAFCPTSNLFLGSGLLDLARLEDAGVTVSVATDIGGGTSFSLLRTLAEAYKILQLQGQSLHPLKALYMATLGNAKALQLDDKIGNFTQGKEADFSLINLSPTQIQKSRQQQASKLDETLFALMMLGDEHNIERTYSMGKMVYSCHSCASQE
ncbi:guanine deaminase [Paraglaciecola aquimarina]|uniref:Guanine deaminase n=1 Tax=Paraglaciecola algarum TaxID=3050085 RepID=A0ABS9DA94_9ALTE|nr:guanine deaminase [Paraglaciecola sp. G1-23]MCF2948714.1 guanine deaminase [Paraglaciecola sp. G1-23]